MLYLKVIVDMNILLLGNSIQIKELNETIKQVAPTNIGVLITGESGTGKELVANSIHFFSKRKNKPLVKVNCGAIPEGIIESELFGHQKGSFTGAIEDRKGYFEMADNGTIFLDEIGEMPLSTQVKILRVLETGEFMRVGGNKNMTVNVRVIAATNRNLEKDVLNNNFREDLYYRLKSINLHIPPLRERKSDVKLLFNYFVELFCKENNISFKGINEEAMDFLINFDWKGNARELRNFCESVIVLYPEKRLDIEDIKKHLRIESSGSRQLPALASYMKKDDFEKDFLFRALLEIKSDLVEVKDLFRNRDETVHNIQTVNEDDFQLKKNEINNMNSEDIDKRILEYLLTINNWDINSVSEKLGQTTRNIYRKIRKYNLKRNRF